MKNFVLANAILELLAGFVLFVVPQFVPDLAEANGLTLSFAKMYGAAALTMGFLAVQIWKNYEQPALQKLFLNTFLVFHAGVAIAGLRGFLDLGMAKPDVAIIHTVFFVFTAFFFFKNQKNN